MTKRIKYKCSVCHRSGAGYQETIHSGSSERKEDIPPDNWLHMYGSVYLCSNCSDNPKALHEANLLVTQEKATEKKNRRSCILLCLFILIAIGIAFYAVYAMYGEDSVGKIIAIVLLVVFIFVKSIFKKF